MPVLASNPVFDDAAAATSCASSARTPSASPTGCSRSARGRTARALGRELRERVEATHSVEHWADAVLEAAERAMNDAVLHLQKVAGISGLRGAPALAAAAAARARLGRPHADAARGRAGRLGLRARARGARRAARRDPAARRRRPARVLAARRLPRPRTGPTILHTHLVHADAYGQMAGLLARVPVRFSTKHGFNEFREGRAFALGDRDGREPRARAHRDLARPRALSRRRPRASREESFEIVHYGIDAERRAGAVPGRRAAPALRRPADPDQGPHRAAARVREARQEVPGLELDIAGRGPLEPALRALARELGVADSVRFLGHVTPIQARSSGRRSSSSRRWARASGWSRWRRWSVPGR